MARLSKVLFQAIWIVLAVTGPVWSSSDPALLLEQGNKLYADEKYSEAVATYLKASDAGFAAPELFYNLGNAYYKSGDYPNAILFYERALKLAPADADIAYNLKIANLHTVDKIEPLPKVFYEKWIDSFLYGAPVDGRAWTSIVMLWVLVILVALYLFSSLVWVRKAAFSGAAVVLVITLFTLGVTWKQHSHFSSEKEAVVFSESVYIKSSPDDKSANLFMLHSGTKVQVLDELKDWKKIRIANGNEGWIGAADVRGF